MANGRVTINDIAAAAGVSKATVSRYLNGKTNLVSAPARARIKKAIAVTGYRPSAAARALSNGPENNVIGIVVDRLDDRNLATMAQRAASLICKCGYQGLVAPCTFDSDRPFDIAADLLVSHGALGVLFLAAPGSSPSKTLTYVSRVCTNFDEIEETVEALVRQIAVLNSR